MQLYEPQTQDMRAKIKNSYIYIMHKWVLFSPISARVQCDIDFIHKLISCYILDTILSVLISFHE